jgi:hypothetical protein
MFGFRTKIFIILLLLNFSFINFISDAFEEDFMKVFSVRLFDYAASTAIEDINYNIISVT